MKFPSIKDVAESLAYVKRTSVIDGDLDVRLQVMPDGDWAIRTGSSDYDQDHRGYWGASGIDRRTNCRDLARELIDQAKDHAADCGEKV